MERAAALGPTVWGLKATVTAQAEWAASELPQELVAEKSALPMEAFVTDVVMRVRGTSPALVRMRDCVLLTEPTWVVGKTKAVAERASVAGAVAVPERVEVWMPRVSVTVTVADRAPRARGWKVSERVQEVCGARAAPQVLRVSWKSVPLRVTDWMGMVVPPVFWRTRFWAALMAERLVLGKARLVGVSWMAAGAVAVPERDAVD